MKSKLGGKVAMEKSSFGAAEAGQWGIKGAFPPNRKSNDPRPGIPKKPAPEDDPATKKKKNPYEITC